MIGDLENGIYQRVVEDAAGPTFIPPDLVVYGRFVLEGNSVLFAQRLTPDRSGTEGPAVPVSGPVRTSNLVFAYSASASGSLVYLPGFGDREKILVDRRGEVVDTLRQQDTWTHAFARGEPSVAMAGANHLWLYDLDRGIPNRLVTRQPGSVGMPIQPVWSAGDSTIAFGYCRLQRVRVSDLTITELVPPSPRCLLATDWSEDGRYLVVTQRPGAGVPYHSVAAYDLEADSLIPLAGMTSDASEGSLSPDGRWLAYASSETGNTEVYVRPFLQPGRPILISLEGGRAPQWRSDGRELYFESPDGRIMAAAVTTNPDFAVSDVHMLFRAPGWTRPLFFDIGTPYDASPDGQLFVLRLTASGTNAILVQNWRSKLR
jgi:hypothetical protein